ncbi:MAG TPA: hypothetical protein VE991_12385 [Acidimicrobiales bacterium]|nr:hypothetical protein [Acidimicrobiales bacterium]
MLDRLLERAHRIELHGESLRRPSADDGAGPTDDGKPTRSPRKRQ